MLPPLDVLERLSRRITQLRTQITNCKSKEDRISFNGALVELMALRKDIEFNREQ
jgi:hypothetical protein